MWVIDRSRRRLTLDLDHQNQALQPLRQTEGLIGSIVQLLDFDLQVPDHSTISRRAKSVDLPVPSPSSGGALQLLVDASGLKLSGPGA